MPLRSGSYSGRNDRRDSLGTASHQDITRDKPTLDEVHASRQRTSQTQLYLLPDLAVVCTLPRDDNLDLLKVREASELDREVLPPSALHLLPRELAPTFLSNFDDEPQAAQAGRDAPQDSDVQ